MTQESRAKNSTPTSRIHPDDRDRIAGLNVLARKHYGVPQNDATLSYYTPVLIQCTLPHSDPKVNPWIRKNGDFSLIVSSGFDGDGKLYGIPYGSFPRLMLAYIITRVIQTGGRRIELSSHFGSFLKEIGYIGNLRGNIRPARTVRDQLLRLLLANIRFEAKAGTQEQGRMAGVNINVATKYDLWWDFKCPEQDSLFGSYIEISEEFRQAILSAPVPLRTDLLKSLKKSPLALDVYMWVSYRLFTMKTSGQESVELGYGRLQEQFGTGISEDNYRKFRQEFRLAFQKVVACWKSPDGDTLPLRHEFGKKSFVLYRSPLLVGKPKLSKAEEQAQRILDTRCFDEDTKRRARMLSGNWDVGYLTSQYFDWLAREGIVPKNPPAHFLDFIKTHRKRHGESV